MRQNFLLRHGIRLAALSALAAVLLFTVVTILSYHSDKRIIGQWEDYMLSEEQLFRLRQDANRLYEIEHRLGVGGVHLEEELKLAGTELSKIPSLENLTARRITFLRQAREHLLGGRDAAAGRVLKTREFDQVSRDLRERLHEYEMNERLRLQDKVADRLEQQARILEFDVAAIFLAVLLLVSSIALIIFYIQRLRRFDRDLIAARHEAERASRLKSAFLANMSHEIRTPLNGVLGLTRLLRETRLNGDQEEIVSSLEASGRTLLALVNDILDLSKIESGKVEVVKEAYDLKVLLEDIAMALRPSAERKRLGFQIEGPGISTSILGDVDKVRQVLMNLVSNAVKFTSKGGVTVRVLKDGGQLRFEVKDSGIGIPPDSQERIFRPFEQADSSTSRLHGGSGLGLAICRHLVRAMGGQLGLQSQVGVGSVFWFELPYESGPPLSAPIDTQRAAPPVPTPASGSTRILLVEDNEVNAHLVVSFLRRRGFDVELAEDGERALQTASERAFDLCLMDIHLPKKDGLETTKDLRRGVAGLVNSKIPIVALTASAIKGEREKCLAMGMDDFLTKPIDLDLLEKTIRRYVAPTSPVHEHPAGATAGARRVPDLDEDLRDELLKIFRRVTPGRLEQLREAVGKSDWNTAGRIAHTMKSSAAQLGFFELAEVCKDLEAKGFGGDTQGWDAGVADLEKACREVLA